jgi:hypothetical protein
MPQQPMPPVVCLQNAGTTTVSPCQCYVAAFVPSRAWHSDICAVAATGMEEQPPWRGLTAFHCSHNCISAMDPSLRLLPALQVAFLLAASEVRPLLATDLNCCCSATAVCQQRCLPPGTSVFMHVVSSNNRCA